MGVPPVVGTQLAIPAGAESAELAADWDDKNTSTLLKLSSRARFSEASGNKIMGFGADLELYLRVCARPVQHWGYFFMASLGAEEAEKLRRSHLADAIADYSTFKKGVESLFGKFEFESSFRAQLRIHAQAGAVFRCLRRAHDGHLLKSVFRDCNGETAFARCGPFHRGSGRLDDARLLAARPRVPRADVARVCADGASLRSVAPLAARTLDICCSCEYEGRRARTL